MSYLFTSEAVSAGHPDKVCDQISDAILDLFIARDKNTHTAIETLATTNKVIIAGETLSSSPIELDEIYEVVRGLIKNIGYDQSGFSYKSVEIHNFIHRQSPDITNGIKDFGAGDQGIMFGYAKKEKGFETEYMPLAIYLANSLLYNLKQAGIKGLEPDAKSQITLLYDDKHEAIGLKSLVLSTQHQEDVSLEQVKELVMPIIKSTLPESFIPKAENLLINPAGRFVVGGPDGDTGLTGRKIIVDTYGGYAPHGGGAFSGKDPSKVDRSAAYMMRYLAKNVVASGLADECLLQISYAIGKAEPLSFYIDCKGTAKIDESKILLTLSELVDLTPRGIINRLDLLKPIYTPTAAYGHFGRKAEQDGCFSWEKTDLVEDLKKCL